MRTWRDRGSPCEELPHSLDEPAFGEWLHEKGIGARLSRPTVRCQNAEHQHDRPGKRGILLDRPAQGEPIEPGHHDLGDDDCGLLLPCQLESDDPILGEIHRVTGLVQKESLELAHMWVALDDQNECASIITVYR